MQRTLQEYMDLYAQEHTKSGTRWTHFFGIPMIVASLPMVFFNRRLAAKLFVGGWALQALGHCIEGNKPAFFGDPLYLLVGPVWVAREVGEMMCGKSGRRRAESDK